MPDRPSPLLNRLLLGAICLFSPFAIADAPRWYQVELIVFSNPSGGAAEQWEATPELEYPGSVRFLIDPTRVKNNEREHTGVSRIDSTGRQLISASPTSVTGNASTDIPVKAPGTGGTQP